MSQLRKIPHTILFSLLFTYLSINVLQPCVLGAQTPDLPVRCVDVITTDHRGVELSLTSTIFYDPEEDEIYVTDGGKGQLVIYTSDYFPHLAFGAGRGLNSINSCYVSNGLLYACLGISKSDPRGHIAVLNRALLLTKKIYFTGFEQATSFIPRKMAVGLNANLYVAGVNSKEVIVLDPDGKYLRSIIQHELVLGVTERAPVVSITVGQDGRLYFLSEDMSKIYVYDRNEEFLYKFGQKGGDRGNSRGHEVSQWMTRERWFMLLIICAIRYRLIPKRVISSLILAERDMAVAGFSIRLISALTAVEGC